MLKCGDKTARSGTHYTGKTDRLGHNIMRISQECPCSKDDCPFDGTELPVEPDMVCSDCGTTLDPNPVQYELAGKQYVAHNLVCPMQAMTDGCLD